MFKDRLTGKYHTYFREYDAAHGRWMSEDPAGYQDGMNLYGAYMGVNGVDALGDATVKIGMDITGKPIVNIQHEDKWYYLNTPNGGDPFALGRLVLYQDEWYVVGHDNESVTTLAAVEIEAASNFFNWDTFWERERAWGVEVSGKGLREAEGRAPKTIADWFRKLNSAMGSNKFSANQAKRNLNTAADTAMVGITWYVLPAVSLEGSVAAQAMQNMNRASRVKWLDDFTRGGNSSRNLGRSGLPVRNGLRSVQAQMKNNTCGPNCVSMVLSTVRPNLKSYKIMNLGLNSEGTSISKLAELLNLNGVMAKVYKRFSVNDIASATASGKPLIAHVNTGAGGHFVVIDGVAKRSGQLVVAIRDPWKGVQYFEKVSDFVARYSGWVVKLD